MNLHIIQPTTYTTEGKPRRTKSRRLIGLSLPYLAALAPGKWKIKLFDERLEPVDFDSPCDVAAITVWTRFSRRAYDIADEYRKRGIPVLMGGPHTYFYAGEVAERCDAYALGEAEDIWPVMLEDAAQGRLRKEYRQESLPSMRGLPRPRYDLVDLKKYPWPRAFQMQTTRGCPYECFFCEETVLYGKKFRSRPVEEIVAEIKAIKKLGCRIIYFVDSVFAGARKNCEKLLAALVPLKIKWAALWTMNNCNDGALVKLAQRAGCIHLNMGMESVDEDTLRAMKKNQNKTREYHKALMNLKKCGISYSLNFVYGWDTESESVYKNTLRFLEENKVPMAFFNLLTPRRGAAIYDKLKKEGRLLEDDELNRKTGMNCQFQPKNLAPQDLVARVSALHGSFYSIPSIFKRLRPRFRIDFWLMLLFNLFQWSKARKQKFGNLDPF